MKQTKGFLLVATLDKCYLTAAIFLADSIKDYYPEAKICLFTEIDWIDDVPSNLFDEVVYDNFRHKRTKLYALDKSPWDVTCYLDCDMYCEHEDIATVFDQLSEGKDLAMTNIRPYNSKITEFPGGELTLHCGMFVYRNTEKTQKFFKEWWSLFQKQETGEWQWDTELYPEELRNWDQWSFWWLQNKTDLKLDVQILDDDARWNFVAGYKSDECEKPVVLRHDRIVGYASYR